MTPAGILADPRVRLGAGTAALLLTAVAVHRDRVGPGEAAVFRVPAAAAAKPPDASITERLYKITDREVPGIAVVIAGPWRSPSWATPRTTTSTPSPGSP
jgi:hypothetical protein